MALKRCIALILGVAIVAGAMAPTVAAQNKTAAKPAAADQKLSRKQAQAALREGYDHLAAKKLQPAITAFTRALNSGRLQRNEMAKAMFYRGRAYRMARQPANAISDLTSALWLKGALSKSDTEAAMNERQLAYKDAGVGVGAGSDGFTTIAQPQPQAQKPAAGTRRPAQRQAQQQPAASSPQQWQATTTSQAVPTTTGSTSGNGGLASAGNGITSFFSGLFGAGQASTAQPSGANQPLNQAPAAWKPDVRTASRSPAPAATRTAATASGRYVVQVASFRSRQEAETLARKISGSHAGLLGGRQPSVEAQAVGNMGTFYHVRVRPYQSAAAPAPLCRKLLASGLDCLVTRKK